MQSLREVNHLASSRRWRLRGCRSRHYETRWKLEAIRQAWELEAEAGHSRSNANVIVIGVAIVFGVHVTLVPVWLTIALLLGSRIARAVTSRAWALLTAFIGGHTSADC